MPRESFDNVGYELIGGKEYSYIITNTGEGNGGQSGYGVYEVIDEEDITAAGGRDPQTANQELSDHDSYEDMDGVESEKQDGESSNADSEESSTQNEDYVSMKGEKATTEDVEAELVLVKNEAYSY